LTPWGIDLKMSDILIMSEGVTDRGAIKTVAKRLRIRTRFVLMHGNQLRKIKGVVEVNSSKYDKFIVLKDLHTHREENIRKWYNAARRDLSAELRDRLTFVIVKHAIEAWFLADTDALNATYDCSINKEIFNPEDFPNPSEELENLLRKHGKSYIKSEESAARIMQEADLQKISDKAPSFRRLIDLLKDP